MPETIKAEHDGKQAAFHASLTRPSVAIPLVVLMAAITFFWALGDAPYWDRDEPRNAGCAAEMMARGNWIVPTFNDELRQQKPVLLYWLMGVAYSVFGVNEFAGRFFSALLAVGTVVATWGIAQSFFDRATALLAGLILSTSVMFCVAARAATPDSLLIFCVTMALWFFASKLSSAANPFSTRIGFFGIYLFLGLAMLSKGPVGFVLPMAVMGWFLLQQDCLHRSQGEPSKRWSIWRKVLEPFHPIRFLKTLLSMRPLTGSCVALAVAAPWFIAVGVATDGEFLRRFFFEENFGRATKVLESHSGGLWFYPLAILLGFFPWSIFWGPLVVDLGSQALKRDVKTRNANLDAGVRFALCWIVVQVVAFSLVKTKLPSYVTPCYPALAMLMANAIMRLVRSTGNSPQWIWTAANSCLVLSGIGIAVGFGFAAAAFGEIPAWLMLLGMAPLAMGIVGVCQMRSASKSFRFRCAVAASVAATVFSVGLLGVGASDVGKRNRMAFTRVFRDLDGAEVATFGCLESSWVYYSDQRILELRTDDREDVQAESRLATRKFWQRKPWLSPRQFAASGQNRFVVTTEKKWPELKKRLPEHWSVVQTADWFMKDERLVLVGRTHGHMPTARRSSKPEEKSSLR